MSAYLAPAMPKNWVEIIPGDVVTMPYGKRYRVESVEITRFVESGRLAGVPVISATMTPLNFDGGTVTAAYYGNERAGTRG
jgi:hypothetical protein